VEKFCTRTAVNFCRFPETAGEFHDNLHDGLISVCRKLLLKAFPHFDVNGYEELRSAAPVLYMGESAKDVGLYICSQVVHSEQNDVQFCGHAMLKVCKVPLPLISWSEQDATKHESWPGSKSYCIGLLDRVKFNVLPDWRLAAFVLTNEYMRVILVSFCRACRLSSIECENCGDIEMTLECL